LAGEDDEKYKNLNKEIIILILFTQDLRLWLIALTTSTCRPLTFL
jgi:hypothetical protein